MFYKLWIAVKKIYNIITSTDVDMSKEVDGIAMSDEELAKKVEKDLKKQKFIFDVLHEM